ncbi:MAG: HAD family hydrolase [Candidatus Margulisiibacteriota bacterium]
MKTNPTLFHITNKYSAVLVDNYGVLRTATAPFPRAYKALRELQDQGKEVFIFSNTASHLPEQLCSELAAQGVKTDEKHVITAGSALSIALEELGLKGKPLICVGNQATEEYVKRAGGILVESLEAEAAILGHHVEEYNLRNYSLAWKLCKEGRKPALLVNTDKMIPIDTSSQSSGPGYIGKQFEEQTGITPIGIGKPFFYMYQLAFQRLNGLPKNRILAIGDTLETDILGASNAGIDSLLVLSGLHAWELGYVPPWIDPSFPNEKRALEDYLVLSGLRTMIVRGSKLDLFMRERKLYPTYTLPQLQ